MLFWFLLALMTGAAVFSVLWPLGLRRGMNQPARAADIAVYRDQLSEVERDRARGLIPESEAEAARVEIARRLLGASKEKPEETAAEGALGRKRFVAVAALVGIPAAALLLYFSIGSPWLSEPDVAARGASPVANIATLLARVENHLAEKPDDGRGWELLAPIYLRLGRTADAVKARENALRLLGETADRQADLGEALVADANGVVTANARGAFERAHALDGGQPKALFFLGLAAEQDGRKDEAERIWRALAAETPADAPYLPAVREGLERLKDAK
jgi:cytochrome c-type biogenesis protein CcmH